MSTVEEALTPGAAACRASRVGALPRWLALAAIAGAALAFVGVVASVTFVLRGRLREQVAGRDAAVLHSVVLLEVQRAEQSGYPGILFEDDMLGALIDVSRLDGVIALRLFEPDGSFFDAAPATFIRGGLEPGDLESLGRLQTVTRYRPEADLRQFFYDTGAGAGPTLPLLEVIVPVHRKGAPQLIGVAQFLLNGEQIARSFAELDSNLLRQATLALAAGLLVGGGLLGWALWRLQVANRLLLSRSEALASANRELVRSAKTSAIGAVTAHLIHALKNPLASLQVYMESRRGNGNAADDGLDSAGEAARRMQVMIQDAVAVLRQEAAGEQFDFTLDEIARIVADKCGGPARLRGVELRCGPAPDLVLDNRRGNLLTLAAINLAQNAVDATPRGGWVKLDWEEDAGTVQLSIADSGPGLPQEMMADPFQPRVSAKTGGSGVGLAITRQLVVHMGGTLTLVSSGPGGTTFAIGFAMNPAPVA